MAEGNGSNGKAKRRPDFECLVKHAGRYINVGAVWEILPKDGEDPDETPTRYSVRLKMDMLPANFDGSILMSPPRR